MCIIYFFLDPKSLHFSVFTTDEGQCLYSTLHWKNFSVFTSNVYDSNWRSEVRMDDSTHPFPKISFLSVTSYPDFWDLRSHRRVQNRDGRHPMSHSINPKGSSFGTLFLRSRSVAEPSIRFFPGRPLTPSFKPFPFVVCFPPIVRQRVMTPVDLDLRWPPEFSVVSCTRNLKRTTTRSCDPINRWFRVS